MISSKLAQAIVNRTAIDFGTESIPLDRALGRTLREDIHSDRDLPPYDRVTMDGIAIKFETFADGSKYFPIEGTAAAGKEQFELKDKNNCVEVMTGAVLPKGTDTIIQYEWLEISDGGAHIVKEDFVQGKNVHAKGTDRAAGSLVIPKDRLIGAAEIGLAATFGKHELLVSKRPDVAIVSTGDELVEIHEQPLPHQIRKSNVHMIEHSVVPFANTITRVHLQDDLDATVNTLRGLLDKMPLIILSGGVSKGKFDYLPKALEMLEVECLFHRVKQRPGKPLWFGKAKNGTIVFALPGNPVSSFMCTHRYVLPWLRKSLKLNDQLMPKAILEKDFHFKPELTYYLQVAIRIDAKGSLYASPVEGHGSGDLANLIDADAFLELPADQMSFKAGTVFPLIFYRSFFN